MASPINQRAFIYTCPDRVFDDKSLSLNELRIYMMVRSFLDSTGTAYPSNQWIAERLNIEPRSARRCVTNLVEKGHLFRVFIDSRRYLTIINPAFSAQVFEDNEGENDPILPQNNRGKMPLGEDTVCPGGGDTVCPGGEDTECPPITSKVIISKMIKRDKSARAKRTPTQVDKKLTSTQPKEHELVESPPPPPPGEQKMAVYQETLFPMPQEAASKGLQALIEDNPHNIPPQMIEDWLTVRKAKKCPVTPTAWKRLNQQLAKCDNPIEAFETMVTHGWTALNPKWLERVENKNKPNGHFNYDDTSWAHSSNRSILE